MRKKYFTPFNNELVSRRMIFLSRMYKTVDVVRLDFIYTDKFEGIFFSVYSWIYVYSIFSSIYIISWIYIYLWRKECSEYIFNFWAYGLYHHFIWNLEPLSHKSLYTSSLMPLMCITSTFTENVIRHFLLLTITHILKGSRE